MFQGLFTLLLAAHVCPLLAFCVPSTVDVVEEDSEFMRYVSDFPIIVHPPTDMEFMDGKRPESNVYDTGKRIPERWVRQYISDGKDGQTHVGVVYHYGGVYRGHNKVTAIVYRIDSQARTLAGTDVKDAIAMTYNLSGKRYSKLLVGRECAENSIRSIYLGHTMAVSGRYVSGMIHVESITPMLHENGVAVWVKVSRMVNIMRDMSLSDSSPEFWPLSDEDTGKEGNGWVDAPVCPPVLDVDTCALIRLYGKLMKNPDDKKVQKEYFEAFPGSKKEIKERLCFDYTFTHDNSVAIQRDDLLGGLCALCEPLGSSLYMGWDCPKVTKGYITADVFWKKFICMVWEIPSDDEVVVQTVHLCSFAEDRFTKNPEPILAALSTVQKEQVAGFFNFLFSSVLCRVKADEPLAPRSPVSIDSIEEQYAGRYPSVVAMMMEIYSRKHKEYVKSMM